MNCLNSGIAVLRASAKSIKLSLQRTACLRARVSEIERQTGTGGN